MRKSKEIGELATAFAKFQAEVKDVVKNTDAHGLKYAKLDQALEIARPLLTKFGLSITQLCGDWLENEKAPCLVVETMLMHSSGQWLSTKTVLPVDLSGTRFSSAQQAGKVISYARRYALLAILGMAQEDDDASNKTATRMVGTFRDEYKPQERPAYKATTSPVHAQLKSLIDTLKIGDEMIQKWCEHYDVTNLSLISQEEALDLSNAIRTKYKGKEEAQANVGH